MITGTKNFLHNRKVSPVTEAFKMVYSDLLKTIWDISTLEDQLSSKGIVQKDPSSFKVLPLKKKINILDKIGSVITANPEKFEEILSILQAHVPRHIIEEMKSLLRRFHVVDACKFQMFVFLNNVHLHLCDFHYVTIVHFVLQIRYNVTQVLKCLSHCEWLGYPIVASFVPITMMVGKYLICTL